MTQFRAKWAKRTARPFVEAAEVLHIDTDLVMAAMETDEGVMHVLFSADREHAEEIRAVSLVRGDDGILRQETFSVAVPDVTEYMRQLSESGSDQPVGPEEDQG